MREMQCFLVFANFYHKLIQDYLKLSLPLIQLIKKNQSFVWTTNVKKVLVDLKKTFTSAPTLALVVLQKPFIFEANA